MSQESESSRSTAFPTTYALDKPLPSGLLTFLFTDIEGSTPRWEASPGTMRVAMAHHDNLLADVIQVNNGVPFKHTGDGMGAVFTSPERAAAAAVEIQRRIQTDDWGASERLKVRIGLHMGEAEPARGDYFGQMVNRAARIMDVANGDQIAVSSVVASFVSDHQLHPMGEHQLRGIGTESISLLTSADLVADERPLRTRVQSNTRRLPVPAQELIGRQPEIKAIRELLRQHQSVTVVGPGGVGKTRLSIDVGHAVAEDFPDGVVLCELVPLSDGDSVPEAVATALGARAQPGMTLVESIVNFLESRKMLLILDNCEHVANAARDLGTEILRFSSSRLLATSREPVGLPAEQMFGLDPLDAATEGVELFMARAIERDHAFSPTPDELATIAKICARLDGVPLGIELAAAWTRVLSPADLLERLQDRFQVLRGGRSGGRHQTLRDTVQWSYEQLDERQAKLFDRLSVFAGGFSLDAVEAVCADDELIDTAEVLDLIMVLVDKSMVVTERGVGHIRFTMLGILRQFGQERLDAQGETTTFRARHADYFRSLAVVQAALMVTQHESDVWHLLDREWANLRGAFESMVFSKDMDGAVQLLLELGWFASLSMRFEVYTWTSELFDAFDVDSHPDAGSLYGLRALDSYFLLTGNAIDHAEKGLEIDHADRFGYCRVALSAVSLNNVFDAMDSETITADWLEHLDDSSPMMSRVWAEGMRTFHICSNDPSEQALVHAERLMRIATESDSATAVAVAHWASGMTASFEGVDKSLIHWRQGIDSAQSLSPSHLVYQLIVGLVLHFSASRGDLDETVAACLDAVEQAKEQHYLTGTSHLFGVTAILLCRLGQPELGAKLLGSMEANGHLPRRNAKRAVEKALGDSTEEAKLTGAGLTVSEAADLAIEALRAAAEPGETTLQPET